MNKLDILYITGAIISIISAIVSLIILFVNKSIRNEIIDKKQIGDYTEFITNSKKIIENIRKYTIIKPQKRILTIERYVEHLQKYYELLKNIEHKLSKKMSNQISNYLIELEKDIQFYSNSTTNVFIENKEKVNNTYFNIIKSLQTIKNTNEDKIF